MHSVGTASAWDVLSLTFGRPFHALANTPHLFARPAAAVSSVQALGRTCAYDNEVP